jgi:hypothetical protein
MSKDMKWFRQQREFKRLQDLATRSPQLTVSDAMQSFALDQITFKQLQVILSLT